MCLQGDKLKGRFNSKRTWNLAACLLLQLQYGRLDPRSLARRCRKESKGASQAEESDVGGHSVAGPFLDIFPQQRGPSVPESVQSFVMQMIHFGCQGMRRQ